MNLRYKIAQLKNSISFSQKDQYDWLFIYGVPRSGTTYFFHELMQLSKLGISDYDLGTWLPVIDHIDTSGYIPIDTNNIRSFIKEQMVNHGAPGGGNKYDFIVKQVNTDAKEFQFLCELMGSEPKEKYFLYREPTSWLPSAMKKYSISSVEAEVIYRNSLASYHKIGGCIIEYGLELQTALHTIGIPSREKFEIKENNKVTITSELQALYLTFNKTQPNL
jgi:hypothetical protein